jgi:hypothetical protein
MSMQQSFDHIFELAVLARWEDQVRDRQSGLIHVEQGYSPNGRVGSLRIWSSTKRGCWHLACEYCPPKSPRHGLHFEAGIQANQLGNFLELVLQPQDRFEIPPNLGRRGLVQITQPTAQESAAALLVVRKVFEQLASLQDLPA